MSPLLLRTPLSQSLPKSSLAQGWLRPPHLTAVPPASSLSEPPGTISIGADGDPSPESQLQAARDRQEQCRLLIVAIFPCHFC